MRLFNKPINNKSFSVPTFDKHEVMQEILQKKTESCPEWNFFRITKDEFHTSTQFNSIDGDFLAIYTDVINKEVRISSNPFTEYKNTVESVYQIVREIYITDKDIDNENNNYYKRITARTSKELFSKLKKEQ